MIAGEHRRLWNSRVTQAQHMAQLVYQHRLRVEVISSIGRPGKASIDTHVGFVDAGSKHRDRQGAAFSVSQLADIVQLVKNLRSLALADEGRTAACQPSIEKIEVG